MLYIGITHIRRTTGITHIRRTTANKLLYSSLTNTYRLVRLAPDILVKFMGLEVASDIQKFPWFPDGLDLLGPGIPSSLTYQMGPSF